MIRSLGPPPLPGRETIAENYFALAYDKAARRAVALAAASGPHRLLRPRRLTPGDRESVRPALVSFSTLTRK